MKPLYFVLPCYNEEKSLPTLVDRTLNCAKRRNLSPKDFQLILVENGSKDQSLEVMSAIKKSDLGPWITIVPVEPNRGYGFGVFQGLRSAPKGGFLAWSHADEQCDPEDVFRAWEFLNHSSERKILVKGSRRKRRFSDWVVSRFFEVLASAIFLKDLHEINAQPKVFDGELLFCLDAPPFDFAFDLYVLVQAKRAGFKIAEIPVDFPPRKHGQSNWSATFQSKVKNISKMIKYMILFRLGMAKGIKG